jgi:hypothetical protein
VRWAEHIAPGSSVIRTEFKQRNAKRQATGLRLRSEDNIKLHLKEMEYEGMVQDNKFSGSR